MPWRSPLTALATPPAGKVRWLMRTQLVALANYLGDAWTDVTERDEPPAPAAEAKPPAKVRPAKPPVRRTAKRAPKARPAEEGS